MSTVQFNPSEQDLLAILQQRFGFAGFRANQKEVCLAAAAGRDVLLVMPTGAGKSLCYQLPAIARGGTALVISPLIALMDDQAARLETYGLRVGRIHSGLSRDETRLTCRAYLDGNLEFLFIAPERLRVPGFPEMLAKRKPTLIAIDEAHCISQWGHDFRPDYRLLNQYLPLLRPAPVIALTATATPAVQDDIVEQLGFEGGKSFIHGFRRENLYIEVAEVPKPQREALAQRLLRGKDRLPAIVYVPSRKSADTLAQLLGTEFSAAAYHAGLDASQRERVQRAFLSGELQVMVATIAFGMGIDKTDVRTILHLSLPASLEAYYQEIGRAGRDGNPSRTVLMHSWGDRRVHDFFMERDYPAIEELEKIHTRLKLATKSGPLPMEDLQRAVKMDQESFDKAFEKLVMHGGADVDYSGLVSLPQTTRDWRKPYMAQSHQKLQQLDRVMQFAKSPQCRMSALVRHFGDVADSRKPCGKCDFCSPETILSQIVRKPDAVEEAMLRRILDTLQKTPSRSTGKLFEELAERTRLDRNQFEAMLSALAAAGLIALEEAEFSKDGRSIAYVQARLTEDGRMLEVDEELHILLREPFEEEKPTTHRDRKSKSSASKPKAATSAKPLTATQQELEKKLRTWRLAESSKLGKPAFIIFGDKTLAALVREAPRTLEELMNVDGIGPAKAERFGAAIVAICSSLLDMELIQRKS